MVRYELLQRGSGSIRERIDPTPPHPMQRSDLESHANQNLLTARSTAQHARLRTAEVRLVHLHRATESVPSEVLAQCTSGVAASMLLGPSQFSVSASG